MGIVVRLRRSNTFHNIQYEDRYGVTTECGLTLEAGQCARGVGPASCQRCIAKQEWGYLLSLARAGAQLIDVPDTVRDEAYGVVDRCRKRLKL